ncbi:MAG TPA: hypothetical protein VGO46_16430 [Gemmatimonadaceae bacterium]|nr:hypothetical protein [Gemmatimonadaceae bacterium]
MLASPFSASLPHFGRNVALRTLALLAAVSVVACSARKSAAGEAGSPSEQSDESGSSESGTGTGHLHLTGDVTIDHDFIVDACQVAPPGDGLLAGYHMNAKDGDSTLIMLSVVVKSYDKDGSFSPTTKTAEAQIGQVMNTGSMDFMTLMVAQKASPMPIGIMLKPESKLVATIADNGVKGKVDFTDMESPLSFEDINLKSNEKPHGKRVSGSITWSCGKVERINAQMDAAVNGMMKKLMPAK